MLQNEEAECLFESNIRKVAESNQNIILVGDINLDMRKEDKISQTLLSICKSNGLTKHRSKATRINPTTGTATIIDHVWANNYIDILKTGAMRG